MFEVEINPSIKSLNRLKSIILKNLNLSINLEKVKIYSQKGIEVDDADIEYLSDNQTVYLSLDGSAFSVLNYVNEYKFIKWIKSGGYGKVFAGILNNKF